MPGAHRNRRSSTSDNYDDLLVEIETLRTQLNTTTNNLSTLRGTNSRLTDRISHLETSIEDQTVRVNEQDKDALSLRRQLRISSAEITRLRTEKEVLEREYEDLNSSYNADREDCKILMDKVAELEEQLAAALHLHVVSENRGNSGGQAGDVVGVEGIEGKKAISWLDLKAKLRETEDELDAVNQERDWLESQLEKMIHSKEAVGGVLDINLLRPMTSMSSIGIHSTTSRATSRGRSEIRGGERMSLGAELGSHWNPDDDYDSSSSTEHADDESDDSLDDDEADTTTQVPTIMTTNNDDAISMSSKRNLKDFALRLDTSGKPFRPRPSFSSQRAPSVAASIRSRITVRSRRDSNNIHDLDAAPGAPVATTSIFHEIERQHDAKVSKLQNDIVTLSTDLQGEIELLQQEVDIARAERDDCILEIQKLSTEVSLTKARDEDARASVDGKHQEQAALIQELRDTVSRKQHEMETAIAAAVAAAEAQHQLISKRSIHEIHADKADLEPLLPPGKDLQTTHTELPAQNPPCKITFQTLAAVEPIPTLEPADLTPVTKALEIELVTLQERDQSRLLEILDLKSQIDIMTRDLREKDTLLRAEVVRLERDLDELIRDNRNMRDDAEINHYKVENLADELDRTRELLQLQASERREFMEEIERLQTRIRELEIISKLEKSKSPILQTAPIVPVPAQVTIVTPTKATKSQLTTSTKSDFQDPLSESEADRSPSYSESDAPPPSPVVQKRRRSSAHKHHHKKEKREKTDSSRKVSSSSHKRTPSTSAEVGSRVSHKRTPSASEVGKSAHKRTPSSSEVGKLHKRTPSSEVGKSMNRGISASEIGYNPKVNRRIFSSEVGYNPNNKNSSALSRKISMPVLSPVQSLVTPSTPSPLEPAADEAVVRPVSTNIRSRSATLPSKMQRPAPKSRTQTTPAPPTPDKTYFRDLMVGGYALNSHEYNKYRRQARKTNLSVQIKVTARGVESNGGRVGTGAPIGVGGYADEVDGKRSVRKSRRRRESTARSDDEDYDSDAGKSWLSIFRK